MSEERSRSPTSVIAPSRRESFNRVIAEAFVNGIPVVASDLAPHRELLAPDVDLLFPPEDVGAAAALVDRLAGDADEYARKSASASGRSRRFDSDLVAERLVDVWLNAGGREPVPALPP